MVFIYDESAKKPFTGGLSTLDPTKAYLKHYDNKLYLSFIVERGTLVEKFQALKELKICDRKLKYWENQFEFSMTEAIKGTVDLKRKWSSK